VIDGNAKHLKLSSSMNSPQISSQEKKICKNINNELGIGDVNYVQNIENREKRIHPVKLCPKEDDNLIFSFISNIYSLLNSNEMLTDSRQPGDCFLCRNLPPEDNPSCDIIPVM